jgi:hypothetical protein
VENDLGKHSNKPSVSIKEMAFFKYISDYQLLKKAPAG